MKLQICIEAVGAVSDGLGKAGGQAQLWERLEQNSATYVGACSIKRASSTLTLALRSRQKTHARVETELPMITGLPTHWQAQGPDDVAGKHSAAGVVKNVGASIIS